MPTYVTTTSFRVTSGGVSLRLRHNGHDGVSNHQPHHCLLNRLFGCRSKKHQSSASLAFVRGIPRGPVNSPHKWPVTRKMFPFDDVIMLKIKSPRLCFYRCKLILEVDSMPIVFQMLLTKGGCSIWHRWRRIWLYRNVCFLSGNREHVWNHHLKTKYWCTTILNRAICRIMWIDSFPGQQLSLLLYYATPLAWWSLTNELHLRHNVTKRIPRDYYYIVKNMLSSFEK